MVCLRILLIALAGMSTATVFWDIRSLHYQRTAAIEPLPASMAGLQLQIESENTRSPPVAKDFQVINPFINTKLSASVAAHTSPGCSTSKPTTVVYGQGICYPKSSWMGEGPKRVTCAQPGSASSPWLLEAWLPSESDCSAPPTSNATGVGLECVEFATGSLLVDCRGGSFSVSGLMTLTATTAEEELTFGSPSFTLEGPDGRKIHPPSCSHKGGDSYTCSYPFKTWEPPGVYTVSEVRLQNSFGTVTTYTPTMGLPPLHFTLESRPDVTPPRLTSAQISSLGGGPTSVWNLESDPYRQHHTATLSLTATDLGGSGVTKAVAVFAVQYDGRKMRRMVSLYAQDRKSGDAWDGEYRVSFTDVLYLPGTWTIDELYVYDAAGNMATVTHAEIAAMNGSIAVIEVTGPGARNLPRAATLVGNPPAYMTPYLDLRKPTQLLWYNLTLEGVYDKSVALYAECNWRAPDNQLHYFLIGSNWYPYYSEWVSNGNTVIQHWRYMYPTDYLPGTYRLVGCMIDVHEFGVAHTTVYGELMPHQREYLKIWGNTVTESSAVRATGTAGALAVLVALAAVLGAGVW